MRYRHILSLAMLLRTGLYFILICLLPCIVSAQQFGGHPPSQKWRQIDTDTVRIIFPPGIEEEAAKVATIIHRLGRTTYPTIGSKLKKISVVLQNRTTLSNGYVGLGPWRSEFYLTPMQNSFELGSIPWASSLALHEFRHVQQYSNTRKGISSVVYAIFGEQALDLVSSAALPNWFWEGDAVHQETIESNQGRGRLAYFFNDYRAVWAARKDYSWMKLRNGSLRDYVPDHYRLGYMMIAYAREKYGDSLWTKVSNDAVRFRGLFYPFQHAIKKHTGQSFPEFRRNAFEYFQHQAKVDSDLVAQASAKTKHFLGDQEFPQFIDSQNVIYVGTNYKRVPAFMIKNLETDKVREVRKKDISSDHYFSYKNGKIVYAAYVPDLRWRWRDYSEIRVLDLSNNAQKNLTTHSRYFSPDISDDAKTIVAVDVDVSGKTELHLLNATDGNIEKRIGTGKNLVFTYPKFYEDAALVTAARNANGEMALLKISISNGAIENLTGWSTNIIGFPSVTGDTIAFSSSRNQHDELFVFIKEKLYQVKAGYINASTGNYQLHLAGNKAVWTSFTAVGLRMIPVANISSMLTAVDKKELALPLPTFGVKSAEKIEDWYLSDTMHRYSYKRYPKAFRLLNIHSFRPYLDERDYKFSLIGQNVLNTLQSELFFNYNTNERSKRVGADLTYGALFPWIRGGVNYTIDRSARYRTNTVYWNEFEGRAGFLVPLNFSKGRYFRNLSISSDLIYNKRNFQGLYKDSFDARGFAYMRAGLTYSGQVQSARQHIYPRYAQAITLSFSRAIHKVSGTQFLASANWYLPGLFPTHNLIINTAFQGRDTLREVNFSNSFPFSRGYIAENFHRMYKAGVNYHLPLVYPDWGFGNIVYFLRVRANLFCDFTRAYDYNTARRFVHQDYLSAGTEIFFDTKWWNQHNVTFGVRYSNLRDAGNQGISPNQWEFILPVSIF